MATTHPEPSPHWQHAIDFDPAWIKGHVDAERRTAGLLSEIREAVFGAQDGLISILAVVSTVAGASNEAYPVLVAGLAAALAGILSMSVGEYMSSKSQREIFDAQIAGEAVEVQERPGEAEAEVAYLLQEEGLEREAALRVARELAAVRPVLLKTMVEKELGLAPEDDGSPLRGALVMGAAFAVAALVPLLPYLLLPLATAVWTAVLLTGLALFCMGVLKSRWTRRHWLPSGLEILALGAVAGIAGWLFGTVLPALLGVAGVAP
ncbi:MAG: VIT1/CCC1 transporter family protein [Chloroflexi bacterium]|nr:VIT1/CCC1 transporter family protein [Chloroflexota bacterium]